MSSATLRYADFIIRWRWPVVLVSLVVAVLLASGARFLTFSDNYRVYFSPDNPQLIAHDTVEKTYIKVDNTAFVIRGTSGDVFTPERLAIIKEVTDRAWQLPYVIRVDSITNYQHTWAEGDDLLVRDLVPDPGALTPEDLVEIREIALSEPSTVNRLVSADGRTAAVAAVLQFPDGVGGLQEKVANEARLIREDIEAAHPDVEMALSGVVMLSNAFQESSQRDIATLFPLMGLFLTITMFLFLGSVGGTITAFIVVLLSAATAMGGGGFAGLQITPASAVAPIIVLTIAIADSIHILVTLFSEMDQGRSRLDALRESLRVNMQPVFLTSVTTAIGFLSLNFSDSPPFRDMGNICAMGAVMAWLFSITLLPAMMAILPVKGRRRGRIEGLALKRISEFVIHTPGRIMVVMIGLAVALALFLPGLSINDKFVEYFAEGTEFRDDSDFISKNLPGIYLMDYSVGAGSDGGISEPEYLQRLDAFARWLEAQPEVVHVNSFTDIMKRLNKSMHGDDPDWYRLPDSRELAAQYLLLYEMSLPYGLDLNNQIDISKSATRIMVIVGNVSSTELRSLKQRGEDWLVANSPEEMHSMGSGVSVIFSFISQRNVRAMFVGTSIALVLISGCLFLALRSFRVGLISLLPNLMPPVYAFGIWAIIVGEVGMYSAIVVPTALGLIVDFTVHFLSKYMRARRERGESPDEAVRYAFRTVGAALWISAFVLVAGFTALMFSDFVINAYLGIMTSMIIVIALITDFLLLPSVLLFVERRLIKAPQTT